MSSRVVLLSLALLAVPLGPGAAARAESTCVSCHRVEEGDAPEAAELNLGAGLRVELPLSLPTREWAESIHAEHEVSCDGCHGGDPHEEDADESMSEEAGFLENPSWMELADFCGVCHESVAASYHAGRFGQLMRQGQRVPTCASCHMAEGHRILAARPAELEPQLPCPGCPPVEGAPALIHALEDLEKQAEQTRLRIAVAEAGGIALADLRRRLAATRAQTATVLHGFDHEALLDQAARSQADLLALQREAEGWEREATRRRRFGSAVLAVLAVIFAALLAYRVGPQEQTR